MAVASRTIERFAEVTLVPRVTIGRVARALREANHSLFPHDPVGRNKSTENTPPHLVNLLIGTAVGDPITAAPRLVQAYRQAIFNRPLDERWGDAATRLPILTGQYLGVDLEILIDLLARPSVKEEETRQNFDGKFKVTLVVGEALVATVEQGSLINEYDAKPFNSPAEREKKRPEVIIQGRTRPAVPLRRIVHLDFSYFEVAAELWADSLRNGATYTPSLLDPLTGIPDENAALPGAASTRDQGRTSSSASLNNAENARGKKKTQAQRFVTGHPIHINRMTNNERSSRQSCFEQLSAV